MNIVQKLITCLIISWICTFNLHAQLFYELDSIRIIPDQPTSTENTQIVLFGKKGLPSINVVTFKPIVRTGNNIRIDFGTCGFYTTVIDTSTILDQDTIDLGILCKGMYSFEVYNYYSLDCISYHTLTLKEKAEFKVINNEKITLELPELSSICLDELTLDAGYFENIKYTWSTGDGTQKIDVDESGSYIVTLSKGGCEILSDTAVVTSGCDIYFPNAFTPNNDGLNDTFSTKGIDIKEFEIRIYNRWGRLVNYSTLPDNCWDGTINGYVAPQGIYYWVATFIYNARTTKQHGHLNLIR